MKLPKLSLFGFIVGLPLALVIFYLCYILMIVLLSNIHTPENAISLLIFLGAPALVALLVLIFLTASSFAHKIMEKIPSSLKWTIALAAIGFIWGIPSGIMSFMGECRIGGTLEYYNGIITGVISNPTRILSVVGMLPAFISYPIMCNQVLNVHAIGLASFMLVAAPITGMLIGAPIGFIISLIIQRKRK